jgi:hypothetical protein
VITGPDGAQDVPRISMADIPTRQIPFLNPLRDTVVTIHKSVMEYTVVARDKSVSGSKFH